MIHSLVTSDGDRDLLRMEMSHTEGETLNPFHFQNVGRKYKIQKDKWQSVAVSIINISARVESLVQMSHLGSALSCPEANSSCVRWDDIGWEKWRTEDKCFLFCFVFHCWK